MGIGKFELRTNQDSFREEDLVKTVIKHSEKFGRPEFDKDHTLATYKWAVTLSEKLDLEPKERSMIRVASLLHDQGYDFRNVDGQMAGLEAVREQKDSHLKRGSRIGKKLYGMNPALQKVFNKDEWGEVVELINLHDKWKLLEGNDYPKLLPVIVAADTFAQIDLDEVIPTFNKSDLQRYFDGNLKGRIEGVKRVFKDSEYIVATAETLYKKYGEYIEKLPDGKD